ncbi:hypothetical protein BDR05DRAFT_278419 [Suillus weaverae]|nr:hypothetical protein BDR05DRAFT_278419 [Suillus weaverae]
MLSSPILVPNVPRILLVVVTAPAKWQSCSHLPSLSSHFPALSPHNLRKVSPDPVMARDLGHLPLRHQQDHVLDVYRIICWG